MSFHLRSVCPSCSNWSLTAHCLPVPPAQSVLIFTMPVLSVLAPPALCVLCFMCLFYVFSTPCVLSSMCSLCLWSTCSLLYVFSALPVWRPNLPTQYDMFLLSVFDPCVCCTYMASILSRPVLLEVETRGTCVQCLGVCLSLVPVLCACVCVHVRNILYSPAC
jgi:hypothetical protein